MKPKDIAPTCFSLGSIVLDGMMARTMEGRFVAPGVPRKQSKRAKADFLAAFVVLKNYEQRGNGI